MEIITRIPRMVSIAREFRGSGQRVGLVPTQGALHEGHLSLMGAAREMCDIVIVSILSNHEALAPQQDEGRSSVDLARDAELAFTRGVDFIFAPADEDINPKGALTFTLVDGLSNKLDGISRPDRFRRVTTTVNKLLNIIHPNFAFFGLKDAQQVIIIKRMVRELAMDAEIVVGPTVREEDGLALSWVNVYLSTEERKAATVLRRALERCRSSYSAGERDSMKLVASMRAMLETEPLARIDYIAITDTNDLEAIETIPASKPALVSMAVFIGETRLVDNVVLNGEL
ncbi:MAG TPA: pantoate--beta-alanine ligase [Blastocatellia bacterium]|nr:pantoate--beta-alanine ligase [Blastocatellia bacterium]